MLNAENLMKLNKKCHKAATMRSILLSKIASGVRESIYESCLESDKTSYSIDVKSGCIEIELTRYGDVKISIGHDSELPTPNLENSIISCLPDWDDVEAKAEKDMREEQEFRDYLWRNCRYM